ncbi:histidine kinase, DNA gyrase B-, and HSP90-like ATPase [Nitzschia inconspicua]|uniref:histidine kinase n=1 Tax=Nitzschia inconspicua TaxID=303405 RepID=A0A9K3P9L6_9STRA|nr:histidine kinase, DNA gyrase B-, and HSP90-like ATPase [Nitzschia inconspicua]KAG7339982.1 histidine kinase, DNA gyrase B-, and HSP90-like ATPase [Nitzschia inconspicua]
MGPETTLKGSFEQNSPPPSPNLVNDSFSKKENFKQGYHSHYKSNIIPRRRSSDSHSISQTPSLQSVKQQRQPFRKNIPRTLLLRAILICSLLTAAGVCAAVAYISLNNAEHNTADYTYKSVALSATLNAKAIVERKFQAAVATATLASWTNPNKDDWPFIFINGYMNITNKIAQLSQSSSQTISVLLDPSQIQDFESHIAQVYAREGRPNTTGYSDFGFGVWKPDPDMEFEDERAHDTTGENTWGGKDTRLAVLSLHNIPDPESILYNGYSEKDRGIYLDSVYACVGAHNEPFTSPACPVFTDMLELKIRPGPAAIILQPIFPANGLTELVGFASTSLHWEDSLTNIVPNYVGGLTCVVSTKTASFTFEIGEGGVVELIGDGDLHDVRFDGYATSVILNEIQTNADINAVYTLTVYPTAEMFRTFSTTAPLAVALSFLGVIFLCTMLFFLYDFLMRNEVAQRKLILDIKRRFVRFISHEIRTPLNTVCIGLELLEGELWKESSKKSGEHAEIGFVPTIEDIGVWHTITMDVKENADIAVSILNDMLNYDKLETRTMELETEEVNPWVLIDQTVRQFQLQAADHNVELKLAFEESKNSSNNMPIVDSAQSAREVLSPDLESSNLCVIGDEVRLGQVFRNVISNALKFTSNGGKISVTVTHLLDGMHGTDDMLYPGNRVNQDSRCGSLMVRISDSGIGLTKNQLEMLFAEGVQFDANKLQHGGGSGLGLSIAKGIVELHNGMIEAQSEGLGKGTTFLIELPLYTGSALHANEAEFDEVSYSQNPTETDSCNTLENTESRKKRKRRILVVEDSLSSRKMLIRLLERDGHTCVGASNGRDAVEMMQHEMDQSRFDLSSTNQPCVGNFLVPHNPKIDTILMDYEMPFMNGPDATRALRDLGYDGFIVGVTGNLLVEDVDHFMSCGANEVLAKPISMATLREYWEKNS